MNGRLFDDSELAPGARVLRGFALDYAIDVDAVAAESPFRHMVAKNGFPMSVAMTNCGPLGWVSDRTGYRYESRDPLSGKPWPAMPAEFARLARDAAASAGYASFAPDACLINRYEPGAKMGLHQDRDEHDFGQPIVSVSLGLPAAFVFGGAKRSDKTVRVELEHDDVVVFGGPSRLCYHGVLTLADGVHPQLGRRRLNLTFRRAGPAVP
ncbi:MAG: DNA oxidative demethylase AlkB [Acidobacteria bacterium]|nr:DNA oxidative demethylase AlkB [Acidobacteriota bacterium]